MQGVCSVCDRILIGNRGWPGTCNTDQAGLEFGPVFLLLPLGYWVYVPEPLALKVSYFESPRVMPCVQSAVPMVTAWTTKSAGSCICYKYSV